MSRQASPARKRAPDPPASPASPAKPTGPVSLADIDAAIAFDRLPRDGGIVTPIAPGIDPSDAALADELAAIRDGLSKWAPARSANLEQRVRNLLYLPAVVDVFQLPTEPYVPLLVFDRIRQEIDQQELVQILYRIAIDWNGGGDEALGDLSVFGLDDRAIDVEKVRNRAAIYAVKLLGRIIGRLSP